MKRWVKNKYGVLILSHNVEHKFYEYILTELCG